MRIKSIRIENFRAIRFLEIQDIPDAIVVAGPNGCGKSSLFDAIRLLKSAYGQYFRNEYESWFSEFQIDINRLKEESRRVLHDPSKSLKIQADIKITEGEREYLRNNAKDIYAKMNWAQFSSLPSVEGSSMVNPATKKAQEPIVEEQTNFLMEAFTKVIDDKIHRAELVMEPGNDLMVWQSPVVELIFSVFEPKKLGIIDYYGPNRTYNREKLGGLNLQINDPNEKYSQQALYNTQNKYSGVKTEMAQSYVKQLLSKEAGVSIDEGNDLKATLDELFSVFFPGKKFIGARPTPDGELEFPVRLENGHEHDINELSSGEKEVLLGYLRIRNNVPHSSVILLDEPELHLNPRLIRGLPRFYQKHLGEAVDNQLWLITHSDTLLREAVEEPAYDVYHMQPSYNTPEGENQVDRVSASAGVEQAIINLVGDLATYSPRSKVVLLEGENSEFDASLVRELFPEFAEQVNLVSVGNKRRVSAFHELLEKAAEDGRLDARFYSIVDRDFDGTTPVESGRKFQWDVYHIENYLLQPKFIREAMRELQLGELVLTEEKILQELKSCADETVDELVRIQMDQHVNRELVNCISTGFSPQEPVSKGFRDAAQRSLDKMQKLMKEHLQLDQLQEMESEIRSRLSQSLGDNHWISEFKGRDVLKRFVGKHHDSLGVSYDKFRNLIINRMRDAGYRPEGMSKVIIAIINS